MMNEKMMILTVKLRSRNPWMLFHQELPRLSLSEHVAVNFEQGFYIGEMIELIDAEYVKISYIWLLKRFI